MENDNQPVEDVLKAVETSDWPRLRELSLRPGGFGSARQAVWPFLLNVSATTAGATVAETEAGNENGIGTNSALGSSYSAAAQSLDGANEMEADQHDDERQVSLDTDRSFIIYPPEHPDVKARLKHRLHEVIMSVLRKRPSLHYFQGYHDIVSVLILTLPNDIQIDGVEKMSLHRTRDAMGNGLDPLLGQLRILRNLIRLADPDYARILEANAPLPYFALSNLLTLFSHDVTTLHEIQHIFDYLLCREPLATVYLAAQLLLENRDEAMALVDAGDEGMLHSLLTGWPFGSGDDKLGHFDQTRWREDDKKDEEWRNKASSANISLPDLLSRVEDLRSLYPGSHPSLQIMQILGPHSMISTWTESPASLPSDDEAERFVGDPTLVVYPYHPTPAESEEEDDEKNKRKTTRIQKKRGVVKGTSGRSVLWRPRVAFAGAVLILGIVIAYQGGLSGRREDGWLRIKMGKVAALSARWRPGRFASGIL